MNTEYDKNRNIDKYRRYSFEKARTGYPNGILEALQTESEAPGIILLSGAALIITGAVFGIVCLAKRLKN